MARTRQRFIKEEEISKVYQNLKVLDLYEGDNVTLAKCLCLLCGNETEKEYTKLRQYRVGSCGCGLRANRSRMKGYAFTPRKELYAKTCN